MSECFFYALQGDADRMMAALPTHQRTSRHRGTGDEHSSVRISVNVQDAHGRTPLHFAVLGRSAACVTALLDKKAKVSLTDDQALHYAVKTGDVRLTEMVMKRVGKTATEKVQADPPMLYAADTGNAAFVPLLAGITPGADAPCMQPLFHRIAAAGSVAFARAAAALGYALDTPDAATGAAPLHVAAAAGHADLVDYLLEHGAAATRADRAGRTPLHAAAAGNLRPATIARLVHAAGDDAAAAAAALDARDAHGRAPLHCAAAHGAPDAVYALLGAGAACDARVADAEGATALHVACAAGAGGACACAAALLLAGKPRRAAVGATTARAQLTPLHVAARRGDAGLCALLLRHGAAVGARAADGSTPLHAACAAGDFRTVGVLLEHGADAAAPDAHGSTPLHVAAAHGRRVACRLLLLQPSRSGGSGCADVNAVDADGNSALVVAVARGELGVVQELLGRGGASAVLANGAGDTALHVAARLAATGAIELVMDAVWRAQSQRLLAGDVAGAAAAGAAVNAANAAGQTALHCALEHGHARVFRLLVQKGCDPHAGADRAHGGEDAAQRAVALGVFTAAEVAALDRERLAAAKARDRNSPEYQARLKEVRARAVQLFNSKPRTGIEHMQKAGMLGEDARDVAEFLHDTPGLNKTKIGEYVGGASDFHKAVLREFVRFLRFKNLEFEMALRRFLTTFRLPGEAQVIDRIMEAFAKHYYEENSAAATGQESVFASADAVYVLAFSTIMLNTDAHSANVKNKMTKPQWLATNRKINDGQDFPQDFLEHLYDRIVEDEIKMEQGVFTNAEKKGWMTKQGGRIKTWKRRWFILNDTGLYYFKKPQDTEPCGIIMLDNVEIVPDRSKKNAFLLRYSTVDLNEAAAAAAAAAAASGSGGSSTPSSAEGSPTPTTAAGAPSRGSLPGPLGDPAASARTASGSTAAAAAKNTPAKLRGCKMDGGSMTQSHHKVYLFCAESAADMESWMTAINSCIHHNPFFALMAQKTAGAGCGLASGSSHDAPLRFTLEK